MKAGRILVFISILFSSLLAEAQLNCVTADYSRVQISKSPEHFLAIQQAENFIRQVAATPVNGRLENGILKIPVVIHNLYHSTDQKITDEQVAAQLDLLNKAFRRQNADTIKTPAVFKSVAADCEIEFHLATSDPMRRSTTGILRKYTPVTNWVMDDKMKSSADLGDDPWDSRLYLNIWVCQMERFAGYSTVPGSDAKLDGIVLGLAAFGAGQKTIIHEAGHWMGLKHIWGDTYCGDDGVDDTPKQASYTVGCPSTVRVTCGNSPTGDMYNNYMDFTNDACMNLFTRGQKARMQAVFSSGGARNSLVNSGGLDKPLIYESPLPQEDPRWLEVKMYPNPVTTTLYLDFSYDVRWVGKTIFVTNLVGQSVKNLSISSKIQSIDVSNFKPGIYFLAAKNDQGLSMKMKFIKL
jgi:hypothetical protein